MKINKTTMLCLLLASLPLLPACAKNDILNTSTTNSDSNSLSPLTHLYQYHLFDSHSQKPVSLIQMVKQLSNSQVIFVGELHTHQASHLLQIQLLEALYQQNPQIILSMEQFSRPSQAVLDSYLEGRYGENTLIEEGDAWENYKGSYRAILEFARQHQIPVIAANAPNMFVRCVGRQGPEVLKKVPKNQQSWSAQQLDLDNPHYKKKFMSHMKHAGRSHGLDEVEQAKRQNNTYAAQLLRDTTMAESIAKARKTFPDHQVIHLNGAFHSDSHLGTVAVLKDILPGDKHAVLSPVSVEDNQHPSATSKDLQQGDYLYLIQQLPSRYKDMEKMNTSIIKLIEKRKKEKCTL